jgi:chromosome segregation protein
VRKRLLVHLKSLTLKGFKSFASATTLHFEPGITCVVGPNGSGKSNVVDALAWVMGEQGAKSLRGGKMEDVIFAGTAGRPPLGRAEVSVTIDNTDGALPIDYAEVTVTRTMFRAGGSDYAINGRSCRLLDVQELLSDSGIGREMHVIVGQGQLDAVLSASPEERRGFLEEAAGVLKHRKRKEKALRKLEAMEANLVRLQDLTAELRRQLKPLGRQAEVARRAATVQADLRDARARLLADDLVQLTAALAAEIADETALRERRAKVEARLSEAAERERRLEAALREGTARHDRAQQTWYALASLRDRIRGTADLAGERVRLSAVPAAAAGPGRDPEELDRDAERVRGEEAGLAAQVAERRVALDAAVAARRVAESALAAEEARLASAARAAADRREGLARLAGQVAAHRSRVEAGEAELGRLRTALAEAQRRGARAREEFAAVEAEVAGLDAGEVDLDAEHEDAARRLADVADRLSELRRREQEAERDRAAAAARREALEVGLARKDGSGALLGPDRPGVLGSLAALVEVDGGYEAAVAAALGAAADAVAVDGLDAAVEAMSWLAAEDAGRASLVVAAPAPQPGHAGPARGALPAGARPVRTLLRAPARLAPALAALLDRAVVVADLPAARELVRRDPGVVAVTRDGDVLGAHTAAGGSATTPSLLEVQAAVEEAQERLAESGARREQLRFALAAAEDEWRQAADRVDAALERLHESDARLAAVAEALAQLGAAVRGAGEETGRLERAITAAAARTEQDRAGLAALAARLATAEQQPAGTGADPGAAAAEAAEAGAERPSAAERDRLAAACTRSRQEELDVRLGLRTVEERARALTGRAEALARAARQAREAQARAREQARQRAREAAVAAAVATAGALVLSRLETSLQAAAAERAAVELRRGEEEAELAAMRGRVRELTAELEELVDSVHRDEVARAEQRLRIEALAERAGAELGLDAEALVEEYGPHRPVPTLDAAPDTAPDAAPDVTPDAEPSPGRPYVRAEQEQRLRAAERDLARLGTVNPLALEEYAALEERHAFLGEALEDLRATRRDLLDIVREVDERVEQVFTAAFADTAREFETVFARLFPGGEGRLVLTDPSDLLVTGVEVEARPPGKKVKRLSLLSGGERSLTAVALLVAIFKARPSPFYVMDEVEAALDDVNLGRLLVLLEELRESSQLLVVTHQKRTMEIADALYGTSMRGDGVTTVIGQRLREPASA